MKNAVKKVLAFFLTPTILCTLVSCGSIGASSSIPSSQASAAVSSAAQAAPEQTVKLTFANVDTEEHPVSKSVVHFAEHVAKLSNNSITIDYYLAGVLGDEEAQTEGVLSGELDITRVNGGNVASWVPSCGVFSIPFLFNSLEDFQSKMTDPVIYEYFDAQFQKSGFKLLAFWYDGVRHAYTTDRFIETVDDLSGLKMRTMTSPLIVSAFEALGVKPTPINYSEVYTALQQGVVSAAENNMNALYDSKHYEVAPYISGTGHLMFPGVVIMNLSKWNSLSEQQQKYLVDAMAVTLEYEYEIVHEQEQNSLNKILEDGGQYQDFPVEQKALLQEKLKTFYDTVAEELGQEVIDLVVNN